MRAPKKLDNGQRWALVVILNFYIMKSALFVLQRNFDWEVGYLSWQGPEKAFFLFRMAWK